MTPRRTSVIFALLMIGILVPSAVAAGYQISASDTTPIPERTIDFQGNSYTIDSSIRVAPGASISIDVTAPDEVYRVYLYNSDEQIVADERGDGSGSFSFDLTAYEPGSYVVTTYHDGQYTAIKPLLVSGYDVTPDTPATVTSDESFEISLDVTMTAADEEAEIVKVIVAQGGTTHTVRASETGNTYTATVDAETLSEGEYTVYGVVQRSNQAFGRNELVGLSNGMALTVSDSAGETTTDSDVEPTDTATPTPDDGNSASTETPASNEENSTTETSTPDGKASPTETNETTQTSSSSTPSPATTTSNDVLTPNQSSPTEPTDTTGPGFTIGIFLLSSILGTSLLFRRR